jgi:3-oxosteroid 1-dehydrogenase
MARDKRARSPRISRRKFLNATGAGTMGAVVGAAAVVPSVASAQTTTWQQEADIVVVGSGAAASSAALNAHRLGNSVIMFEKAPTYGGTTAKSGGDFWIPNNHLMKARGLEDPREDALRYMVRVAYPYQYNPADPHLGVMPEQYNIIAAFYDNAAPMVQTLESMTTLRSQLSVLGGSKLWADYQADLPENKAPHGRAMHADSLPHLILHMQQAVNKAKIPVLFSHRATGLVLNPQGEVIGVKASTANGSTVAFRARKAVIFGSGGFIQNHEFRRNFLRGPVFGGCSILTNEGDFIYIATVVGARLSNLNNGWWSEMVLEAALETPQSTRDVATLPGDSMISVNRYGRRVVNEQIDYNDRGQIHFVWDPARAEYPNLLLFMIYDQRTADHYAGRFPIPRPEGSPPPTDPRAARYPPAWWYVIKGQTLDELGTALAARLKKVAPHTGGFTLAPDFGAQLPKTIARFNEFATKGKDEDFRRGESSYEKAHFPDVAVPDQKNPSMFPIASTGPYYAIILSGGALDTHGGPEINARAQVLDVHGNPIPGLYGAGNCVGYLGQAYWGAGGTIGPALTFGYIAAIEAAKEAVKQA